MPFSEVIDYDLSLGCEPVMGPKNGSEVVVGDAALFKGLGLGDAISDPKSLKKGLPPWGLTVGIEDDAEGSGPHTQAEEG